MRILLIVGLILTCTETATAQAPKLHGSWQNKHEDGSLITLSIDEAVLIWTFEMPEKGTTVMKVSRYHITDAGILYGYFDEASWKNGTSERTIKDLNPFTFRYTIEGEKLVLIGSRVYGCDRNAHEAFLGTFYRKENKAASAEKRSQN